MNHYKGTTTFYWTSDSPDFTMDETVEITQPDGTKDEPMVRKGIRWKGFCLFIVDKSFPADHEHCGCVHDRSFQENA